MTSRFGKAPRTATPNHLCHVSCAFCIFLPHNNDIIGLLRFFTTTSYPSGNTLAQVLHKNSSQTVQIVAAALTTDVSISIPISVKKLRCVNIGERAKLCLQETGDSINRRLRATPPSSTVFFGLNRAEVELSAGKIATYKKAHWPKNNEHPKVIRDLRGTNVGDSKSSLLFGIGQYVTYIRALPRAVTLQLALLSHERLEFCFAYLHIPPFLPATYNQPI